MSDVLVRGLDPSIIETLKEQARRNGRSLQAEMRAILEAEAERRQRKRDFFTWADTFRRRQPPSSEDSVEIIREGRGYHDEAC